MTERGGFRVEQTQENVKDVIASPGARFEGSVHISEEVIVELTRKTIQGIPDRKSTRLNSSHP